MRDQLLDYLLCLKCRQPALTLSAEVREGPEVLTGKLICSSCGQSYPITDGVPCFLPQEEEGKPWREAWSYKWENVAQKLRYLPEGDEDFEIKMNYSGLFSGDLSGKVALDAGCGSGHDAARVAALGATVIGVDQSRGVYLARRYNQEGPNSARLHWIRADLFDLPLRPECMDIVYANGVLHHTPDTARAFKSVVKTLKPGGDIVLWVYDRTQYWRLFETFWRPMLSRLPHPVLSGFLHLVNRPWHAIFRYRQFVTKRLNPWAGDTAIEFLFDLASGGHLLYLLTDYHLHLAHRVPEHDLRHHHAFDCYSPRYAFGHDEAELFDWFKEAGVALTAIAPRRTGLTGKKG